MKVIQAIAFFLLMIASSRAGDEVCDKKYQGKCRDTPCDHDEIEVPLAVGERCSPPDRCCVEACEKRWHGDCKSNAGDVCDPVDEIEVDQTVSPLCAEITPPGGPRYKCCVDRKKAPCHEIMDGECKLGCGGGNNIKLGDAEVADAKKDCLCPTADGDSKPHKCCVQKGNDLCDEVKGGKCEANVADCKKNAGKVVTGTTLCTGGKVCCVDDQPCEKLFPIGSAGALSIPMGICIDEDYCPEGYSTPEENCQVKPKYISQWCFDDDHLCCMPDVICSC